MNNIPDDLICHIIKWLDIKNVIILSQVCRRYYNLIKCSFPVIPKNKDLSAVSLFMFNKMSKFERKKIIRYNNDVLLRLLVKYQLDDYLRIFYETGKINKYQMTGKCYICNQYLNYKLNGDMSTCICIKCRKKNLFISKTKSKMEYYLDDNDLSILFSFTVSTRTYGKRQIITLFIKDEVYNLADVKYNGFEIYKLNKEQHKIHKQRYKD